MTGFFDEDFPLPEPHQPAVTPTAAAARAGTPMPRDLAAAAIEAIEKELMPMPSSVGRLGTRAVALAANDLRRHLSESILDPAVMDGPLGVLDAAADDVHALGKDPDREVARKVHELRVTLHNATFPF